MTTWSISVDACEGARCYLSRNWFLGQWLKKAGRLGKGKPDIAYLQAGRRVPDLGQRISVVQTVTHVSEELARKFEQAEIELTSTQRSCSAADVVVSSSRVQTDALIAVGVDAKKIVEVRPASGMPNAGLKKVAPRSGKLLCGVVGQPIPRKRTSVARHAAWDFGADIKHAHSVPYPEIADWIRNIDLLLFPSLGDSWGLAVSEAISCGVPAVVTEASGASEQVRETGAGIVTGTAEGAFRAGVSAVLGDRVLLMKLTRAARKAPVRTLEEWAADLVAAVEGRL